MVPVCVRLFCVCTSTTSSSSSSSFCSAFDVFCPLLLLLCVFFSFVVYNSTHNICEFALVSCMCVCVCVWSFFLSFDGYRSFHLALSRPHSIAHICSLHILIHNVGFLISSSSLIWSFRMFAVLLKLVHVDKRTHTQFVFRHIFFRIFFLILYSYVRGIK